MALPYDFGSATNPDHNFFKQLQADFDALEVNMPSTSTWIPALAGSATAGTQTYSTQQGYYVLLGTLCFVQARLTLTAYDGATNGNMIITGLPFPAFATGANMQSFAIAGFSFIDLSAGYTTVSLLVIAGQNYAELLESGDAAAKLNLTQFDFGNNSEIMFSGFYRTNL